MIAVSNDFKTAMKQPIKELDAYIELVDSSKITSADDLISFKISCDSGMCKTAMRKLEAKYLGEHNLLGQWVHVGYGVKLPTGAFEYLDYGSFLVTEITTVKDTGVTTIVGYDKMINSMKEYKVLDVEYPIDLFGYTQKLCEACSLELGNSSFLTHNDWRISQELWENISGITYRDILVQIAQVTATTCIISNDDKVYFKSINATGEQLTYDNMKKLKFEPIYGEINSVVLGRDPIIGEDVSLKDDESISLNGLTEWRISNNEIIDKDRESAVTPIYNALHGVSYYPFETTTEGLGWYEIADNFNIINDDGDVFNTSLFNFSITVDGAIKEILKTVADTKTQAQYQYASTIGKQVKNVEIKVNKQEQYIEALATEVNDSTEKMTSLEITIDGISSEVSKQTTSIDELGQAVSTIQNTFQEQTDTAITTWFSSSGIEGTLNDLQTALDNNSDEIELYKSYIRNGVITDTSSEYYGNAYTEIGASDNQTKIRILPTRIQFLTNGEETAYISNNSLYITESTILTRQQIGRWVTMEDDVGNLNTYWVE